MWFCKRYRIGHGIKTLWCPICMDPSTKSVELKCGHAFCRPCLSASAANDLNSCALCRQQQVINPEVLRAQFDQTRVANLARRLAIPLPVHPPAATYGLAMSPCSAGKRPKAMAAAVCESTKNEGDAAVDVSILGKSVSTHSSDVGAMSSADLRHRWNAQSQPVIAHCVSPSARSSRSWKGEEARGDQILGLGVGMMSLGANGGCVRCDGDVGAMASLNLRSIWFELKHSMHICKFALGRSGAMEDVGAKPSVTLQKRWSNLMHTALKPFGACVDVGSRACKQLSCILTCVEGENGVGSLSLEALSERWVTLRHRKDVN
ncbi:unnamed protein product [Choristocarpus tenellus]